MDQKSPHLLDRFVIIGGGNTAIFVARALSRLATPLDTALVEPQEPHWYQAGLT
jgi:uncharacterized NAD(P)/FAD-binding protein YdhS